MEKDFLVIDWWHCLVSFAGNIGDIVFLAVIWYVKQTNLKNYVFLYELLQPSQASENFCFCCCCWVASVVSDSVRPHRRQPTRLHCRWGLQARTLEWVAISFSNAWKWKVKVKLLSRVRLLATPWTAAYQAPLSLAFSRQEYWRGLPLPSPENFCYYLIIWLLKLIFIVYSV